MCNQYLLAKKSKLLKKDTDINEVDRILKEIAFKKMECEKEEKVIDNLIKSLNDESKIKYPTKYFMFGINETTKHLERNGLFSLLVVCRSAQPSLMTQHLLCQCLVADIPACAITDLSVTVAKLFALKSTLVIGFKVTQNNPFQDLIDFIKDKIPDVESPWIKLWKRKVFAIKDECCTIEKSLQDSNISSEEIPDSNNQKPMKDTVTKQIPSVNGNRKRTIKDNELLELNVDWKKVKRRKKKKH